MVRGLTSRCSFHQLVLAGLLIQTQCIFCRLARKTRHFTHSTSISAWACIEGVVQVFCLQMSNQALGKFKNFWWTLSSQPKVSHQILHLHDTSSSPCFFSRSDLSMYLQQLVLYQPSIFI